MMMDSRVRCWLSALTDAGYEAYLIGGAVRDFLLARVPGDYDVVTNARPEQIKQIAVAHGWICMSSRGERFGVVVIRVDALEIETTTYRKEVYDREGYRPTRITYVSSLQEDVRRRDFTVNALAMDEYGHIIDYVQGQDDLIARRLVTIGKPEQRLREDATRILRACRFVGQLDFKVDAVLEAAIPTALSQFRTISLAVVLREWEHIMRTAHVDKALALAWRTGVFSLMCRQRNKGIDRTVPFFTDEIGMVAKPGVFVAAVPPIEQAVLSLVVSVPPCGVVRYAALFYGLLRCYVFPSVGEKLTLPQVERGAAWVEKLLMYWQTSVSWKRRVWWLVFNHLRFSYFGKQLGKALDPWLRREARSAFFRTQQDWIEAVQQLCWLVMADSIMKDAVQTVLVPRENAGTGMLATAKKIPVSTRYLLYSKELVSICGQKSGACLQAVLKQVQNGTLENSRERVDQAIVQWLQRQ